MLVVAKLSAEDFLQHLAKYFNSLLINIIETSRENEGEWIAVGLGLAENPIEYHCVTITDPVDVTGTEKDS